MNGDRVVAPVGAPARMVGWGRDAGRAVLPTGTAKAPAGLHFPTLDQLVLDAAAGLMNEDVDAALARVDSEDPSERLTTLVRELHRTMPKSLTLRTALILLDAALPGDS